MNQPYYLPNQPPYGYTPPAPYQLEPYKRPLRRWANIIGGGMLMIQAVMMGVFFLLYGLFALLDSTSLNPMMWELIDQVVEVCAYVLGFWVPTAFIVLMVKIPVRAAFPLRRPQASILIPAVFLCLGASMVGSILSSMLSIAIESAFGVAPIMPDMPVPEGMFANVIYVVSMTVMPAIFEEAMFRGAIMQSLRRFGDGFALVTSAILFGMCHNNLVQGPNAFLLGIVIGYFVLRTGSLITGMVIHFVNNGLAVLFSYLMDNMTLQQSEQLNLLVFVAYIVLGLAALAFLIVRKGNLFRVAPSDYPLPAGKKYSTFFCAATVVLTILVTIFFTAMNFE